MGRHPENAKLVAVREFPRRLLRAKQYYDLTKQTETSWAWVAKQTDHSTSVMSQIKTGEREPTLEEGLAFATLFGVRVEWLLLDSGPMIEHPSSQSTRGALEPPRDMFVPIENGDDLRAALGEPAKKKRRRPNAG